MSGRLLLGIGLLLCGRQLFWLFVAIMGFLFGLDLVAPLLPPSPDWVSLLIAVSLGVVGALLGLLWQWVAVGMAGLLAGGYLAGHILQASGMMTGYMPWGLFILGGLVGAILMIAVGQVTPGPLSATATFIGYLLAGPASPGRSHAPPPEMGFRG